MCNLAVINATKQLYKGPRGGLYWLDENCKKHYIKESTEAVKLSKDNETNSHDILERKSVEKICPNCQRKSRFFTEGICDECWFQEQLKLKGGQYL